MGSTKSIKEKLKDITREAIRAQEYEQDLENVYTEDEKEESEVKVMTAEEIDEIVDEIIEFVYMAAAEGKYEFEVGNYIEKFGRTNYDNICSSLKLKLYDVIVFKTTKKNNVTLFWGNSEV